jgi:hypothetical protein
MNCETVRDSLSAFLDGRLPGERRTAMTRHLAECRQCGARAHDLAEVRTLMLALPQRRVPERLSSELTVMASHERARRVSRLNWRTAARGWWADLRLAIDNAMRPVAVPFAGGLCSALVLFTLLMPNLGFRRDVINDVPIRLYTEASMVDAAMIEMAPFYLASDDEIVVQVSFDENGQIMDYSVPRGVKLSSDMTTAIGRVMLFTSFSPATLFGQPTTGKLLFTFRRNQITVIG